MKVFKQVPIEKWKKQWDEEMPPLLFYAVRCVGGIITTESCDDKGVFPPSENVTHVLEEVELSELIKHDRVEPNEELMKLAKKEVDELTYFLDDKNDETHSVIDPYNVTNLIYKLLSLLNQQDAVKFAEWIMNNDWDYDGNGKWFHISHHVSLSKHFNKEYTTTELYQEYIKTLNK